MRRIASLFAQRQTPLLNVYCTAGYPQLDSTAAVVSALEAYGADLIELGMPYSDPLADGEVIQASSQQALANGMTITLLMSQLREMELDKRPPVILMGYMNPILQYGFARFCADAAAVGVSGLILPDLPMYEFETQYGDLINHYGLDFIFLITPETSEERIRKIDTLGSGFIYAVSSSSTTGNNKAIGDQQPYFERLQAMRLRLPVLVGFGIHDKASFEAATTHTRGAIIGSAYIKVLGAQTDVAVATKQFLEGILR
jgi:tryptophan synthase alpha chain